MSPAANERVRAGQWRGGGLTAERRQARERLRREAAERLAFGEKNSLVAKDLRVTERSVERWRRAWREDGTEGLASRGSPGRPPKRLWISRLCAWDPQVGA